MTQSHPKMADIPVCFQRCVNKVGASSTWDAGEGFGWSASGTRHYSEASTRSGRQSVTLVLGVVAGNSSGYTGPHVMHLPS